MSKGSGGKIIPVQFRRHCGAQSIQVQSASGRNGRSRFARPRE